jgi:hypothetical protein
LNISCIIFVFFEEVRGGLLGVLFPIVLFLRSGIVLFGDVLILFLKLVLSFGGVGRVIVFSFFKIVVIVVGSVVGGCIIGLVGFPLTGV